MKTLTCLRPSSPRPRHQRGVVLIAALAVLLMLTLLSIGMFRSLGLEERITGNSREKQRAFYAAQSTLEYGESWLKSAGPSTPQQCSAAYPYPTICESGTTYGEPSQWTFATQDWHSSYGTPYTPAQLVTSAPASGQQLTYAMPQFAINYLGHDPANPTSYSLYQVTALGFGGSANAAAVVQSVFSLGSGVNNVGK